MVGHAALDRVIGVRIPASQPNIFGVRLVSQSVLADEIVVRQTQRQTN